MKLNDEERVALRRALEYLASGSFRRFQDTLWLGFGDLWTHIETALVREGLIVRRGDDDADLTTRGHELLQTLSKKLERIAG